jgi:hypothetical protein
VEIPKAMIVERIRSKRGAGKANEADEELPDKVDTENDAGLLEKYGLTPDELNAALGGQSPNAG